MDTVREKVGFFLPDEIMTEILARLPIKSTMRYQLVCKRWRDITLTRGFVELHCRNSIPSILVAITDDFCMVEMYCVSYLFALDKWWEPIQNRFMIHRFPIYCGKFDYGHYLYSSRVLFSHGGLIGTYKKPYFIILNPIRPLGECVKISLSQGPRSSNIYGVYYHPSLKEYCCLLRMLPKSQQDKIQYKILNLGSNPCLKTISNPFSNRFDKNSYVDSLFINNCIYWMLKSSQQEVSYKGRNDIMEFCIISEEFKVIPCPVPMNIECTHDQSCLLDIDGVLSFLVMFPSKIVIWRLEDHAQKFWTTVEYTLNIKILDDVGNSARGEYITRAIGVVDGKLALSCKGRLFVCNLMDGTVNLGKEYDGDVLFFFHQMSLASLSNCKHEISIDQDDKVVTA